MEAVGQLTGGVAHDFNNLLTAVMGSLELLRKRVPADPKITALLDNAVLGIQRGAALTQRMLAFARRQDLHTSSTSVPDLVREMSGLLEKSLGPLMKLEVRFPVVLPPVEADANQLETAVLNVALNARDAMADGGTILIFGHQEAVGPEHATRLKPGQYVCLSVSDSGHGMNETVLSRAMEPFYTTKGVGKGTGLGLSMIHGMAEQSGGRLMLRSLKGIGTTAEIWLPVSNRPVEADSIASAPLAPSLRALKILVVDDDELVLKNIVQMLEDSGHSIIHVSSGTEALQVLGSQDQIDVLLTDHAMPGMTGLQLAAEGLKQRPDLPVLLVSGYVEIQAEIDPRIGRLAKPFSHAELLEAIAGVLPQ
jgi:CheY-like chemotaxis protein